MCLHRKADPRADARFHGTLVAGTANTDMPAVWVSPAAATWLEAPCQMAGTRSLWLSHLPPRGSGKPALLQLQRKNPVWWEARGGSSGRYFRPRFSTQENKRVRLGVSQVPFCSNNLRYSSNFSARDMFVF